MDSKDKLIDKSIEPVEIEDGPKSIEKASQIEISAANNQNNPENK